MFDKVAELLAKFLKVDKSRITPETDIRKDFDADSLLIVEMLFTLEDDFGITIDDNDAEKLTVVKNLVEYIEKHQAK